MMDDTSNVEALVEKVREFRKKIADMEKTEKELRENEENYRKLVESSLTGIYIDQEEKIALLNDQFADIYGYSRDELMGMETWKLVHPEDRPLTNEFRAKRMRGEDAPSEYEARGLTKKGETIWVRRRNTDIEFQGKPAILGNIVDVTEEKRTEKKLLETNEELEDFVHVVSHDLKTPILSIYGFSQRLLKNYAGTLDDRGKDYLERIMESARRMEALISDLLAFSRSGHKGPEIEKVFVQEIVGNVISDMDSRLKGNNMEIVVEDGLPCLSCDRERLRQVFQNLMENAIKYTRTAASPVIEIGHEDKGKEHRFHVKDNGIGIDPRENRKIFEKFERLAGDEEEGTGLGLTIVKRNVESLGGRVWVESEKGKGATFYFTLPKEQPVPPSS